MNETNQQRLDRIKKIRVGYNQGPTNLFLSVKTHADFDWLIERAEASSLCRASYIAYDTFANAMMAGASEEVLRPLRDDCEAKRTAARTAVGL